MTDRVLVAGVGNIFSSDDGFGVEVVRRLAERPVPAHVRVADFGIRAVHLAYELLGGDYVQTILVDATPRGGTPGTVYVIEPAIAPPAPAPSAVDAHSMSPGAVLQLLQTLGGTPGHVVIVGCEPATVDEGIGLSAPVERAVDDAVRVILDLVQRVSGDPLPAAAGATAP